MSLKISYKLSSCQTACNSASHPAPSCLHRWNCSCIWRAKGYLFKIPQVKQIHVQSSFWRQYNNFIQRFYRPGVHLTFILPIKHRLLSVSSALMFNVLQRRLKLMKIGSECQTSQIRRRYRVARHLLQTKTVCIILTLWSSLAGQR